MKFLKKAIAKKPKLTTYWTVETWEGDGESFKNVSLIGKDNETQKEIRCELSLILATRKLKPSFQCKWEEIGEEGISTSFWIMHYCDADKLQQIAVNLPFLCPIS